MARIEARVGQNLHLIAACHFQDPAKSDQYTTEDADGSALSGHASCPHRCLTCIANISKTIE